MTVRSITNRALAWTAAPIVMAALGAMLASAPARGAQNATATATATINVQIRSVTLSTTNLTYGSCTGGSSTGPKLGFPNGTCATGTVVVTNGEAPATISVSATNAVPSDGGKAWALCGGSGTPPCAVGSRKPGTDQYLEGTGGGPRGVVLGTSPHCDPAFGTPPCRAANPGDAANEAFLLVGPQSSTDDSATFTTSITWTAG